MRTPNSIFSFPARFLRYRFTAYAALILSVSAIVTSCSAGIDGFSSLANQGIVPLSSSNAYLGSNLFLAHEAEKSSHLFNFLKFKGGPAALEVTEQTIKRPRIVLYYPAEKSVYVGELESKDQYYQWVMRGPYAIERKDYRELEIVAAMGKEEPAFVIFGKPLKFNVGTTVPVKIITPVIMTPLPTPTPKVLVVKTTPKPGVKKAPAATTAAPTATTTPFRPLNSDQNAIRRARGLAERAENGDIMHVATRADETLDLIARWYTGSGTHSAELASGNGIALDNLVPAGTRVRIPARLITNERILSSDFQ